jgi:excisionase family DNA binding protein
MIRFSGEIIQQNRIMSSNLRIVKICAFCKQEFIAKKTTTETCSDPCAKRLYKVKQREKAISRAKMETEARRKPEAFITEEQIRAIQAKEWLTLVEAALLLNVSPLTLRRWVLTGKAKSRKVGRRHLFERASLHKLNGFISLASK